MEYAQKKIQSIPFVEPTNTSYSCLSVQFESSLKRLSFLIVNYQFGLVYGVCTLNEMRSGMSLKLAVRTFVARNTKHVLGLVLYWTGLYRLVMPDCAIVVLFHRIDDRLGLDDISCTTEKFTDFCDFFKKYYKVISYGDLLEKLDRRENLCGYVVITFDDGYRDNKEVAAVELRKRGLTACFFIITGHNILVKGNLAIYSKPRSRGAPRRPLANLYSIGNGARRHNFCPLRRFLCR